MTQTANHGGVAEGADRITSVGNDLGGSAAKSVTAPHLLTRQQILNSRAAYPEGKNSGDPSGKMKEFHDALCDMALSYLDITDMYREAENDRRL